MTVRNAPWPDSNSSPKVSKLPNENALAPVTLDSSPSVPAQILCWRHHNGRPGAQLRQAPASQRKSRVGAERLIRRAFAPARVLSGPENKRLENIERRRSPVSIWRIGRSWSLPPRSCCTGHRRGQECRKRPVNPVPPPRQLLPP